MQPKQCTVRGKSIKNYHTFALVDPPPEMANLEWSLSKPPGNLDFGWLPKPGGIHWFYTFHHVIVQLFKKMVHPIETAAWKHPAWFFVPQKKWLSWKKTNRFSHNHHLKKNGLVKKSTKNPFGSNQNDAQKNDDQNPTRCSENPQLIAPSDRASPTPSTVHRLELLHCLRNKWHLRFQTRKILGFPSLQSTNTNPNPVPNFLEVLRDEMSWDGTFLLKTTLRLSWMEFLNQVFFLPKLVVNAPVRRNQCSPKEFRKLHSCGVVSLFLLSDFLLEEDPEPQEPESKSTCHRHLSLLVVVETFVRSKNLHLPKIHNLRSLGDQFLPYWEHSKMWMFYMFRHLF